MAKKTHHPKPGCQCVLQFWLKSVQICWNYVKISDLVATCCNNAPVDSTPKHFTPLLGRFPLEMCLKNQPENHSGRSCWRAICHTCWAITKLSWLADRPWSRPTADMLCGPTAVRRASRPAASLCKPLQASCLHGCADRLLVCLWLRQPHNSMYLCNLIHFPSLFHMSLTTNRDCPCIDGQKVKTLARWRRSK